MECLCSGPDEIARVGAREALVASSRAFGCGRPNGEMTELSVVTGRLTRATVSGFARDSKWSPAPTVGQYGSAVRSLVHQLCRFCVFAGGFAVIGRHRALLMQGFFADGVVLQPLTPNGAGDGGTRPKDQ
jgi:hypothetical protein